MTLFTPAIPARRRRRDKMHFVLDSRDSLVTLCGLNALAMDQGCLDDMSYAEILEQQDVCLVCLGIIRRQYQ